MSLHQSLRAVWVGPQADAGSPDGLMGELWASAFGPPEQITSGGMVFRPARAGERPDGYYSNRWEGVGRAPVVRVTWTWRPAPLVFRWPIRRKRALELRRARIAGGGHHPAAWGRHR